ncbi:efflux transporter outer membrane subunit [Zavarzinia sp. CC-PAN008]|uniref:efflux transporter outer membrane subunit n=1 Tax=Zavarzinia sp. CC-PAN008 TaxID=3243332 RepID=UPI003F747B9E
MRIPLIAVSALGLLAACSTLEPEYEQPPAPVPASLPQGGAYPPAGAGQYDLTALRWTDFFTDGQLRTVLALALANNRDLRVAAGNVVAARARYRVQDSNRLPDVRGGADGAYQITPSGPGREIESRSYSVSVGFSAFELDLFGRLKSLSNQALQSYFATEWAARATRISLLAETARAYLTLAADRDLLRIAGETLASAQTSLDLTQRRFEGEVASELDVVQARTILEQARADVAAFTTLVEQDRNALDLLVGARVADALLPEGLGRDYTLAALPANLDSRVLLRRPDVLQAEYALRAANANIGAARAAFFPTISLTTSAGLSSTDLGRLFSDPSQVLLFNPSISIPIFNAGENEANLDLAQAQRDVAVSTYERAIQVAFREVADSLAQQGTIDRQLAARAANVEAAQTSYRLSNARYDAGVDTFLNTLDAQRTLYQAQQALVSTRLTRAANLVTLYATVGGGLAGDYAPGEPVIGLTPTQPADPEVDGAPASAGPG